MDSGTARLGFQRVHWSFHSVVGRFATSAIASLVWKTEDRSLLIPTGSLLDTRYQHDILHYKITCCASMRKPGQNSGNRRAQLNKGVLELALLCVLQDRPCYGLEILEHMNGEAGLDVADGTIYPLLHRMEAGGLVEGQWRIDGDQARPRKYYSLTKEGRQEMKAMIETWRDLSGRIDALVSKGADR